MLNFFGNNRCFKKKKYAIQKFSSVIPACLQLRDTRVVKLQWPPMELTTSMFSESAMTAESVDVSLTCVWSTLTNSPLLAKTSIQSWRILHYW